MDFVIVTGMSGGGKGYALKQLEDLGYFCVDNIPSTLVPKFAELCINGNEVEKAAVVMDVRNRHFIEEFGPCLDNLRDMGMPYKILFMEASDEILLNRFKQNRRMHPLAGESNSIPDAINEERRILANVKADADFVIDTSECTAADLKDRIAKLIDEEDQLNELPIKIVSFGFKYGIPLDCDFMVDVRFIPNPFYVPNLKYQTGLDKDVEDYVMSYDCTKTFISHLTDMLEFLIPNYIRERKAQLVIGIGCTGGRHRSTCIAQKVYEKLSKEYESVKIKHRDIEKDGRN